MKQWSLTPDEITYSACRIREFLAGHREASNDAAYSSQPIFVETTVDVEALAPRRGSSIAAQLMRNDMLPEKLTALDPEKDRKRYKIVRRDTMADVPGLILSANVETGLCLLRLTTGGDQEYNFGPGGLRIVGR